MIMVVQDLLISTADRLLKEGYEVRVLDSLQKPIHNTIPDYLDDRVIYSR